MCDCKECNKSAAENFGGASVSGNIGQIFTDNQEEISKVFAKHGLAQVPVTPLYAGMAAQAKGPEFVRDMAEALYPEHFNFSGFDENQAQAAVDETSTILNGLGNLASGIAKNFGHKHLQQQASLPPMPLPMPPGGPDFERHDHDKKDVDVKFFGLKPIHIGLISLFLIGVIVFLLSGDKKPAAA